MLNKKTTTETKTEVVGGVYSKRTVVTETSFQQTSGTSSSISDFKSSTIRSPGVTFPQTSLFSDAQPSSTNSAARAAFFNETKPPIRSPMLNPSYTTSNYSSGYKDKLPPKPLYIPSKLSSSNPKLSSTTPNTTGRKLSLPTPTLETYDDLTKVLKIKVKKDPSFRGDANSHVPTYSMHGKSKKKLLVINNIKFDNDKESLRKGAQIDQKNLEILFNQLGYSISTKSNLKHSKMITEIQNFSKSTLKNADISVVVIMSHGTGDKNGNTAVAGTDNQLLLISDIIEYFSESNCPHMKNKPKIFIFQCCRGAHIQLERDAVPSKDSFRDMLLAYSTLPGFASLRNPEEGSWFIRTMCQVFSEHACNTHVEDMLKIVDRKVGEVGRNTGHGQTSSFENRGFQRCYLYPM